MEKEAAAGSEILGEAVEQGKARANDLSERARQVASDVAAGAQTLAQRAREQATTATEALSDRAAIAGETFYRQGAQASTYVGRNVAQYPLSALLIAAVVGYGMAFLIHNR